MLEIKDAVAVITGGASGLGLAVATHWVENGGRVVLADVAEPALTEAAAGLEAAGGEAVAVVCDVTREADCGVFPEGPCGPAPLRGGGAGVCGHSHSQGNEPEGSR